MPLLPLLARKARAFLRLSAFEQVWFIPVWVMLGLARAVILTLSFRRLAPHLGIHAGVHPWLPLLNRGQEARALRIGRVVRLAARYTPWESNCFPQAVTARLLLGWYGIPYALFFGLAKEHGEMKAHAWVAAGRVRVSGGNSFHHYTTVGCFYAHRLAAVVAQT